MLEGLMLTILMGGRERIPSRAEGGAIFTLSMVKIPSKMIRSEWEQSF
ncbi:hypothetical protein L682_20045 [Aquipseudomonas alcaligenes OT 69]|nr:hypothetical protein L682_20045 [Pseudomonas alcaligenes OT 69]